MQLVFDRQTLRPDEDDAVITMHVRRKDWALPDVFEINDNFRDMFVIALDAWWAAIRGFVTQHITLREARFYAVPEGGPFPAKDPRGHMGDPVKIHNFSNPGTGTSGALPPQVAISVTFKTAQRLRWGRFYLPHPARATLTDKGAIDPAAADAILQGTHNLTSRSGNGLCLVVFSHKYWNHSDPEQIQVDDIFDVIRRRRYSRPQYRQTLSAG